MNASDQRIAIVTGGNRGLGLETSRQLAERGYLVLLTARDGAAAEAAARRLAGADAVRGWQLDVTSPESIASFAERLRAELGGAHALVNNAGVSLHGFDGAVVRGTLAVNFFGALRVTRALLPLLADGSNVVMVSSGMGELSAFSPSLQARFLDAALDEAGLVALVSELEPAVRAGTHQRLGWPSSAYRASKAGLNALTRVLARETSRVHINAVCPGWVRTDMGGAGASRGVEQGSSGIVWAATLGEAGPHGGFFRDGKSIPW